MDRTNKFMSSESLQTFRRNITPGKNDSFDALSNQLIGACAEICQKHQVNLNYGDFSSSFQSIVKEYIRGDVKGTEINNLRINGTKIEKSIIEHLEKHVNSADKSKVFLKSNGDYYTLSIMKTNAFKRILSFIESQTFKNQVREVIQHSNLFKQESDRYGSNPVTPAKKQEAPKEIIIKSEIKQESKKELTRSKVEEQESDRYDSNPVTPAKKQEAPKEVEDDKAEYFDKIPDSGIEQIEFLKECSEEDQILSIASKEELTRSEVEEQESDRYDSNPVTPAKKQEAPKEIIIKSEIKQESKEELTRSEVAEQESYRYDSNPVTLAKKQEAPKEVEDDKAEFLKNFDKMSGFGREKIEFLKKCSEDQILSIVNSSKDSIHSNVVIELEILKRIKDEYPKSRLVIFDKMPGFGREKIEFLKECSKDQILSIVNFHKDSIHSNIAIELEILKRIKDKYPKSRLVIFDKQLGLYNQKIEFLKECSEDQKAHLQSLNQKTS